MIDINKFEALANDIIANLTKEEMQGWLDKYQACTVSYKPIIGSFKMDYSKLNFQTKELQSPLNEYSLAA